jgi:hypothetical protein
MKAPDKIYLNYPKGEMDSDIATWDTKTFDDCENTCYIRKDYLLEWLDKELNELYELLPDASNENPSQMELRYLGQYMQTEKLIDELNEI